MSILRHFVGCLLLVSLAAAVADAAVSTSQLGQILLGSNYAGVVRGFHAGKHPGVDFAARTPVPVRCPVTGTVSAIDGGRGYLAIRGTGNYQGYTYNFLHMGAFHVSLGAYVSPGTVLGTTGTVAYPRVEVAGPWLHFEVRFGNWTAPALPSDRYTVVDPANAVNLEVVDVLRIDGPNAVVRDTGASYRLILQMNDGSAISTTKAAWSENSPQAVISQTGRLTVFSRATGTITIRADYAGTTVFKAVRVR